MLSKDLCSCRGSTVENVGTGEEAVVLPCVSLLLAPRPVDCEVAAVVAVVSAVAEVVIVVVVVVAVDVVVVIVVVDSAAVVAVELVEPTLLLVPGGEAGGVLFVGMVNNKKQAEPLQTRLC